MITQCDINAGRIANLFRAGRSNKRCYFIISRHKRGVTSNMATLAFHQRDEIGICFSLMARGTVLCKPQVRIFKKNMLCNLKKL